jgi:hypothetical protein
LNAEPVPAPVITLSVKQQPFLLPVLSFVQIRKLPPSLSLLRINPTKIRSQRSDCVVGGPPPSLLISCDIGMARKEKRKVNGFLRFLLLIFAVYETAASEERAHTNAYATMLYMGTPRDYEFYMATRVMIRSLVRLNVEADLVVIASLEVPLRWVRAL